MKIFITGGNGFIGSHVVRYLSAEHEVTLLLRQQSDTSRITDIIDDVTVMRAELSEHELVAEALKKTKPEVVIHLAWAGVHNKYRNDQVQTSNIHNSIKLLEAAAEIGVKAFVGLGSQAEYGPCENIIDETQETKPTTLYGAAKLATCIYTEKLAEELGVRFAWARVFSTYGPSDHPEWMIPYLIQTLMKGEKPALTKGEQLWDYLYVGDAARAIAAIATNEQAQGVFNLGSGSAVALREIIELIRSEIDPSLPLGFGEVPYRPDQVMHLQANIDGLEKSVGWRPQMSLSEGIAETISWYRSKA